jgi:hypothetical protein
MSHRVIECIQYDDYAATYIMYVVSYSMTDDSMTDDSIYIPVCIPVSCDIILSKITSSM